MLSPQQNYGPPNYEIHPELGYLWPSRQLRQNVRVGLAAAAFGVLAGLAGAVLLVPRHGASPARTEPVLAGAPSDPASNLPPLPASSPSIAHAEAPSSTAARVSTDRPNKQLAPAAAITAAGQGNDASAAVQALPAPATPVVTTDRSVAPRSGLEHAPAEASKRPRKAKTTTHRRVREPYATDAYAASPFIFETRR